MELSPKRRRRLLIAAAEVTLALVILGLLVATWLPAIIAR